MKTIVVIALLVVMLAMPMVLADPGGVSNDHAISATGAIGDDYPFRSPAAAVAHGSYGALPGMAVNAIVQGYDSPNIVGTVASSGSW